MQPTRVVFKEGLVTIELGQATRICRCCRKKIVKGTYHVATPAPGGADYKFCQACVHFWTHTLRFHNKEE